MNEGKPLSGTGLRSFRAKFVLLVGGAVLFDLLIGGGLALWNVRTLSRDAAIEVGQGLEKASQDYIRSYADSTAAQVGLQLEQVHSDVSALAGVLQSQIDRPQRSRDIGAALSKTDPPSVDVVYNTKGGWAQNRPGSASVVSVWGYLLDRDKGPLPIVRNDIEASAALDLIAPNLLKSGYPKLQMYYIGPKAHPIFRTAPYSDQAQTFDRLYPGHNEAPFWTFFFPGLYESWQEWAKNPASRPVGQDITQTAPYIDAITGKLIVSFFRPLWTVDRKDVAGAAGADITLDQLARTVENVKVAQTGFGFLAMSDGNVVAINPTGEKTIGLRSSSDIESKGVTGLDRSLRGSSQKAVAALPRDRDGVIQHISLRENDEDVPYLVVIKQLAPTNLWNTGPVRREAMSLGIVVPEREIYASLIATQSKISAATRRIIIYQILALVVSLMIVTAAIFAASKKITSGVSALARAAKRIQANDYSVRVEILSRDEVGEAGLAFNRMAEEISHRTENLEQLVAERTKEIGDAKEEISELNRQLKSENLRMGAELAIAQRIQQMVLPRAGELNPSPLLEIAAYMLPADEVGGDYYDVLHDGKTLKIGIGDVTGHGLESGILMVMLQSVARALFESGERDPAKFLVDLNRALYKNIQRSETDKHLTLAFLDFDGINLILTGQHEELLILRKNRAIERVETRDLGFPIGLEEDIADFVDTLKIPFGAGDLVLLYTDGITEAESPSGELFGIDRLCECLVRLRESRLDAIVIGVVDAVMRHMETQKMHDDITLVVLKHR